MNTNAFSIARVFSATSLLTLLASGASQAAMAPSLHDKTTQVQRVDCAAGFHIGPIGTCIIGLDDERHDTVIEKRATEEGCETKSVRRTDDMGNTETRTKTNCD